MIPKIFHFIWLGDKYPYLKGIQSKLSMYGNTFKYYLWTDNPSLYIEGVETRDIKEFDKDNPFINRSPVLKSDWYRFQILYKYGGIYSDLDSISIRPLPEELFSYSYISGYEPSIVNEGNLSGVIVGFLMAKPTAPAVQQMIILRHILPLSISTMKLGLLLGDVEGTKILPSEAFTPLLYNELPERVSVKDIYETYKNCYELHLYHGSTKTDII